MMRFTLILYLTVLLAGPAHGQDSLSRSEIRQQLISSCKFWGTCGMYFHQRTYAPRHYELHHMREWRDREPEREPERDARDWRRWQLEDWRSFENRRVTEDGRKRDGYHCVSAEVEVLSGQKTTKDQALNDAAERWAGRTQWIHGGQYMDIAESARFRHRCGPTQPGDGASQRAARIGNAIASVIPGTAQNEARREGEEAGAFRCELVAVPCREERTWRDKDRRQERRR